jgi:hypothetical protein
MRRPPNGAARLGYWGSEGASCAGTQTQPSHPCADSRWGCLFTIEQYGRGGEDPASRDTAEFTSSVPSAL